MLHKSPCINIRRQITKSSNLNDQSLTHPFQEIVTLSHHYSEYIF